MFYLSVVGLKSTPKFSGLNNKHWLSHCTCLSKTWVCPCWGPRAQLRLSYGSRSLRLQSRYWLGLWSSVISTQAVGGICIQTYSQGCWQTSGPKLTIDISSLPTALQQSSSQHGSWLSPEGGLWEKVSKRWCLRWKPESLRRLVLEVLSHGFHTLLVVRISQGSTCIQETGTNRDMNTRKQEPLLATSRLPTTIWASPLSTKSWTEGGPQQIIVNWQVLL